MIQQVKWMGVCGLIASVLAACTTGGQFGGSPASDAERPSSEAPSASPARRSAKIHVELGTAYMQGGRNGVALDEARAAISTDSSYAPGYLLMGMVYAAQEQFALASPSFERAAQLAPGDPEVGNVYGWFLCSQGRESEGLLRLEQAARNPYYATPTRAWTNAGLCLLRKRDDAGAEERLVRAVQADETNAQALLYLADIALRTNRYLRAKQWIDQAQKNIKDATPMVLWLAARIENRLANQSAVSDIGARLRKDFPGSNEYQSYLQGKFE
jgi:type IV pilus assembly protein PilF